MKFKNIIFCLAILAVMGFTWPGSLRSSASNINKLGTSVWIKKEYQLLKAQARNIDDKVLRLALTAYAKARKMGLVGKQVLTVIDYSKPSTQPRLWVFDMKNHRTLFHTYVTHGKNSGGVNSTSFSNSPGSLKSSLGVFVTSSTYMGRNGYSLRLHGMERGVNDAAYSRAIVMHGAHYANASFAKSKRGMGRSWGCPAVTSSLAKPIINTIKDKSIMFSYYPDSRYLSRSSFL